MPELQDKRKGKGSLRNRPRLDIKESIFDRLQVHIPLAEMFVILHSQQQTQKLDDKQKRKEFDETITGNFVEPYRKEDYDVNGMNLLHYCIWKDHLSTVLKLLECGYDPKHKMSHTPYSVRSNGISHDPFTPMELILQKYKEYMHKDFIYNKENDETFVMVKNLLEHGIEMEISYLEVAINFPQFLEYIFQNLPEDKKTEYYNILPEKVDEYFSEDFVTMGFCELILTCDEQIIRNMLVNRNCLDFLQKYKDKNDQILLHSAAKLFKLQIVEKLMDSEYGFARKYNTLDKKKQTPITIVLAEWEESRYFASIKKIELNTQLKKDTAAVVAKILSKISEVEDQIKAIKQTFYGMTALEYDIKSGNGIIVEAICKLQSKELLTSKYNQRNIFHLVAKYEFPLEALEKHLQKDDFHDLFDQLDESNRTPCECAIEYGHIKFVKDAYNSKHFRNVRINEEKRKNWSREIETACKVGNLEALYLFQCQASLQTTYEETWKLLRIACKHNQGSIVEYLLHTARMPPEIEEKNKEVPTVLMLAADCDAFDCVKLLLDYKFPVDDEDENDDNVLCRAIKKKRKKAVMTILTHDEGKKALYLCSESNTTPLRLLVEYIPDIALWVLNDQIIRDNQIMRYDYRLTDDLDHSSTRYYSFVHHYISWCSKYTSSNGNVSPPHGQADQENAIDACEEKKNKKPVYQPTNHMLYFMVQNNPSLDILHHELVKNVIKHYWNYALILWLILRSVYLLSTFILTGFTLSLPHPKGSICTGNNTSGISDHHHIFLLCSSISLIVLSTVIIIINIFTILSIGLMQTYLLLKVFKRFRVLSEIVLAVCNLAFIIGYHISANNWCAKDYQWNFGAICIFLSWMTVLTSIQIFSLQISKLFTIITEFMKIILIPVILLIAFFLPFLMLFTSSPYIWPNNESLNTVIFLVLGISGGYLGPQDEDDFEQFPYASYLVFIGFVIIVTVLFNNLLISLAIGDLNDLHNKAEIEKDRVKINIILDMLDFLHPFIGNKPPDEVEKNSCDAKDWSEEVLRWVERMKYNKKLSDLILKGTDEEIIKQNQEDLKRRLEQNQEDLKRRLEQNQKDLKRRLEELEKQYYANEQRETQISRNATDLDCVREQTSTSNIQETVV